MENFALMRTLIEKAAPELSFRFQLSAVPCARRRAVRRFMFVSANNFRFSVFEDSVWKDVQRTLLRKMRPTDDCGCHICSEEFTSRNIPLSCNTCGNEFCLECYIRLFEHGQGMIICPWCRESTGFKMPRSSIPGQVQKIREKATNF